MGFASGGADFFFFLVRFKYLFCFNTFFFFPFFNNLKKNRRKIIK